MGFPPTKVRGIAEPHWPRFLRFTGIPAVETPAGSAIVMAAETLTGHSAGAVAFAQAHQPDEYLDLARIPPPSRSCGH